MASGAAAEVFAASYLEKIGFSICDRNWRNRFCEIDIVATRANVIHFIEVKYRQTDTAGSGLDYITPRKTEQLKFAAEHWIAEHSWEGDYQIDVIGITGNLHLNNLEFILNAVND